MDAEKTRELFQEWTGEKPALTASAPGRVNLLGEHTDYCGGTVLPMSLDLGISIAAGPWREGELLVRAHDLEQEARVDLGNLVPKGEGHFADYIAGVAKEIFSRKEGCVPPAGLRLLVHGDLPNRAGLSSSAALEVASYLALSRSWGCEGLDGEVPSLCLAAERDFTGLNCGIMDQFASWAGRKGKVVKLQCASLEHELLPLDEERVQVLVADTEVKRALAGSEYNKRTESCSLALAALKEAARKAGLGEPGHLALAGEELLERAEKEGLEGIPLKRARHVLGEEARVARAVKALREGRLADFGRLMFASHESLRDLYEVSCRELDVLVESVKGMEGVLGAKMSGAGFGGAVVALVEKRALEAAEGAMRQAFEKEFGRPPRILAVSSGEWTLD